MKDLGYRHLSYSSLPCLLLKLSCVCVCGHTLKPDWAHVPISDVASAFCRQWLNDQRLVQRLAELMGDSEHPDRQANAGQVIMSVVSCARQMAQQLGPGEKEPNPLVSTIET